MKLKILFKCLFLLLMFSKISICQDINSDKISLTNSIKRMYNNEPFTGVKIIEDYEHNYLISVVLLEKSKYKNTSTMNRVAHVKAQSQASAFLNGSNIEMNFIVKTTEKRSEKAKEVTVETLEYIKENSVGFVNGLELLSNFDSLNEEGKVVFIFIKKIEDE